VEDQLIEQVRANLEELKKYVNALATASSQYSPSTIQDLNKLLRDEIELNNHRQHSESKTTLSIKEQKQ